MPQTAPGQFADLMRDLLTAQRQHQARSLSDEDYAALLHRARRALWPDEHLHATAFSRHLALIQGRTAPPASPLVTAPRPPIPKPNLPRPQNHAGPLPLSGVPLREFAPVGPRALRTAHRESVYHLAAILYRAHTHGWQTTPAPRESYGRPSEGPKTNVASHQARFVRFDANLVRGGIAMRARAQITEREYRRALSLLTEAQQGEIAAYYRRPPYVSLEGRASVPFLEMEAPLPAFPDLSRARYGQTFEAFEALLAQLL